MMSRHRGAPTWRSVATWAALGAIGVWALLLGDGAESARSSPDPLESLRDSKLVRTIESQGTGATVDRGALEPVEVDLLLTPELEQFFERLTSRQERGARWSFPAEASVDGGIPETALVSARGQGTMHFPRKSFEVTLDRPVTVNGVQLRTFFLLNLAFDAGDFRMQFSNTILREMGLFPMASRFVSVRVNQAPKGIYLLVEPPEDAIRRVHPDVDAILRKRGPQMYEAKFAKVGTNPLDIVRRLNVMAGLRDPAEQASRYSQDLELDRYLGWLTFNTLVKIGDIADEVFFYQLPGTTGGRIGITAWDYDDLFTPPLRPEEFLDDPLLFAESSDLNRAILQNPQLHATFVAVAGALLETTLSEDEVLRHLTAVTADLDALDTGQTEEEQRTARDLRRSEVAAFTDQLLKRHRELQELIGAER